MASLITHFEIYGEQPEKLAQFYRCLFGWEIEQMPGVDYWHVQTGTSEAKGMDGGLMYRAISGLHGWMFYIKVDSLEQAVADVQSLGGTVVRRAVPKTAWVIIVADPQGNTFGIWQADPKALPMVEPD